MHLQKQKTTLGLTVPEQSFLPFVHFKISFIIFIAKLASWAKGRSRKQYALTASIVVVVPAAVTAGVFMAPASVNFSYAGQNCIQTNLPANPQPTKNSPFVLRQNGNKTCVNLTHIPTNDSTFSAKVTTLGFLHKNISVHVPKAPSAKPMETMEQTISSKSVITVGLDKPDQTFSYRLTANDQTAGCTQSGTTIQCALETISLEQGAEYKIEMQRTLGAQSETIFTHTATTAQPAQIIKASIPQGHVAIDKLTSINLATNKVIKSYSNITLKHGDKTIKTSTEIDNKNIIITFDKELPRQQSYELSVGKLVATDESYMEDPYILRFSTSGGPTVASTNIGTFKVSTASTINVSFTMPISSSTAALASVIINNKPVAAHVSVAGSTVTITPNSSLPRCTPFTVHIAAGVSNIYGVQNNKSWSMQSRTICQNVFSIGTSVQGRSILAYRFGSGNETIVFVGGMHGNEFSSVSTLNAWVNELERNYDQIPANKSIVVIPVHNPDGYAASSRTNANNVDLNRNFPASDWQQEVYMPGNTTLPQGGGTEPLSEPESAALASYIQSVSPRLVLTYHAVAKSVIANGSGDSMTLANLYGSKSGFPAYSAAYEDSIFNYTTTGEFEDWLHDKIGLPTLLVELATNGSNELYSQSPAMWAMVNL